jgi:hypothetical protein
MFRSSITVGAKSPPFVDVGSDPDASLLEEFIAEMRRRKKSNVAH